MIPESESGQRSRRVRLPPRATPGVRPSPPPRWLVNPFSLCRKGLRRVGTFAGARVQSFAENPQPWVFITGTCVCLMLTFVVIMVKNANEARPHLEVARADAADTAVTSDEIPRGDPRPAANRHLAEAGRGRQELHRRKRRRLARCSAWPGRIRSTLSRRHGSRRCRQQRWKPSMPSGNPARLPGTVGPKLASLSTAIRPAVQIRSAVTEPGAQFVLRAQHAGNAAAANPIENGQDDFSQDPRRRLVHAERPLANPRPRVVSTADRRKRSDPRRFELAGQRHHPNY